jgi:hypothetical protein
VISSNVAVAEPELEEPKSVTVTDLAAQAKELHQQCLAAGTTAKDAARQEKEHARACGQIIVAAKKQLEHGQYYNWLKQADIPARTALRYVALEEHPWRINEFRDCPNLAEAYRIVGCDPHKPKKKEEPAKPEPAKTGGKLDEWLNGDEPEEEEPEEESSFVGSNPDNTKPNGSYLQDNNAVDAVKTLKAMGVKDAVKLVQAAFDVLGAGITTEEYVKAALRKPDGKPSAPSKRHVDKTMDLVRTTPADEQEELYRALVAWCKEYEARKAAKLAGVTVEMEEAEKKSTTG